MNLELKMNIKKIKKYKRLKKKPIKTPIKSYRLIYSSNKLHSTIEFRLYKQYILLNRR